MGRFFNDVKVLRLDLFRGWLYLPSPNIDYVSSNDC